MKITIINTDLSPALARHAEVRARLATLRFRERISSLTITLRKLGTSGASCRMEAQLSGVGTAAGEHCGPDPGACVQLVAARLKDAAKRRLKTHWQAPRRWHSRAGIREGIAQALVRRER